MPKNKPGRMSRKKTESNCLYRSADIQRDQANEEQRSIPLVLASETPIDTFDFSRMDVVKETIRIGGIELPNQIPLLDSHNRDSVRNVLGSIRDLKRENGQLVGRAYFASDEISQQTFKNYRDGHLTDFSVGARRDAVEWDGDAKIVTRSTLIEGSAVVAGADPNAKMLPALRACISPYEMKEEEMEKLQKLLIERGMPETVDGEDVFDWVIENIARTDDDKKPVIDNAVVDLVRSAKADLAATKRTEDEKNKSDDANDAVDRIEAIDSLCRKNSVNDKQKWDWIKSDATVDFVAHKILETRDAKDDAVGPSGRVDGGISQREKFYEAARCGLIQRTAASLNPSQALERAKSNGNYDAVKRSQELVDVFEKPAEGYDQFRHVKLNDLARMFLEESGVRDVHKLPSQEIARRALALNDFVQRASDGPAYNTTGSFANLMLDAANKTLLSAYDEALVTYPMWTRQAPSVADFKNVNRIRFGELSDPEVVPENHAYPEKQTSDARESYAVEKYGELFSISLEAIINDDLNAISRIPAMQGAAMRRKINKVVYAVLTANAALSDGNTLFHATEHNANLDAVTLDVAGSVAAMNTGWTVMATQSGLNTDTILNIQPRFLIVPAALSATALTFTSSVADPTTTTASNEDAERPGFTSGISNIYGPNGPRQIVTVVDGVLDGTSTTGWYLAADPSQVDTVEVTFLQGEESPVLSREEGFTTDTMKYKIRQSFAAAAIDFRGLYQGNA